MPVAGLLLDHMPLQPCTMMMAGGFSGMGSGRYAAAFHDVCGMPLILGDTP
jgi:hypothetical protein